MSPLYDVVLRLAVAALCGLAVGIEREWSAQMRHGEARFAGVRTFLLLGLLGGLAAEAIQNGAMAVGTVLLASAAGMAVAAYVVRAVKSDVDGTTEVAALVVLATGYVAGTGRLALASALCAVTAFVLAEKSRFHSIVFRIRSEELEAGARFAVLALVVLPLLPVGPVGPPPGIRPRELWSLVLVFSGLSFAGFVAVRVAGPRRGYGVAGLLGGLISSTAVTLNFARESRDETRHGDALGFGVIAACTVLLLRVAALAGVLAPPVAAAALPYLVPPLLVGLALLALVRPKRETGAEEIRTPPNPLRLLTAIELTLGFVLVLYALAWVRGRFGSPGILVSSALVGLADMDALTYSMVKLGGDSVLVPLAARALAVGVLANTLLKLTVALALGRGPFRKVVAWGLAALGSASVLGLFLF